MTDFAEQPASEAAPEATAAATVACPFCDEQISTRAKKCKHCGETVDVTLRRAEEALRASERRDGNVYMNAAVSQGPTLHEIVGTKSRGVAVVLAFLLGGFGIHKFYLGRIGWGIIYLIFSWTFIPAGIAFIESIIYLTMSDAAFARKYG